MKHSESGATAGEAARAVPFAHRAPDAPASGGPSCPACLGTDFTRAGVSNGFDLLRCTGCGCVQAAPMPSQAELDAYYQGYETSEAYLAKIDKKIFQASKRLWSIRLLKGRGRFLDVGCNGGYAVEAARRAGYEAEGIDLDAETVAKARDLFPGVRFEAGTVETRAAAGDRFDVIYASEVIEHVIDPNAFVAAIARLSAPGGLLFLTTPDLGHRKVPAELTAWRAVKPPRHLHYFNRTGMKTLLRRHGFGRVLFKPMGKPGMRVFAWRG